MLQAGRLSASGFGTNVAPVRTLGRNAGAALGLGVGVLFNGLLFASEGRAEVPPELGGHLIVSTASTAGFDPRLGLLAAGFARRGLESFVAHDVLRPSPDADELLAKGRRRLDEARRLRRKGKIDPAARAGAEALRLLEAGAQEQADLGLLVEALIERGATAMAEDDSATAETSFLRANALDPGLEPDRALYGDEVIELFDEVRRVSRQLAYGQLRIDPTGIEAPEVVVDFGGAKEPPYESKLADGRHFVSVSGPGRQRVVAPILIRSERQQVLVLRPPLVGDQAARAQALEDFRPDEPASIAALGAAFRLRFVVLADLQRSNLVISSHDGRTGAPLAGAQATLSVNPSDAEIDAAAAQLASAAVRVEPELGPPEERGWLWPWGVLGAVAVIGGGAVASYFLWLRDDTTTYRFER